MDSVYNLVLVKPHVDVMFLNTCSQLIESVRTSCPSRIILEQSSHSTLNFIGGVHTFCSSRIILEQSDHSTHHLRRGHLNIYS
jgi:hypothetical protein